MTSRISVGLIAVILVIGFITGSMGLWGAILTTILVPILVHSGYILNYGQDAYKISELGAHPYDFGYEYEGNGKYVHPDTGAWFQYNDHTAKEYKEGKSINIKPVFALYGTILVIAVVVMQFSSTGISEQDVYNDVKERVMSGELMETFPDAKMSSKNDTKIEKLDSPDPIDIGGEEVEVVEAKYNVKGFISTQNETLPFSYDVFYLEGGYGPIIMGGAQ